MIFCLTILILGGIVFIVGMKISDNLINIDTSLFIIRTEIRKNRLDNQENEKERVVRCGNCEFFTEDGKCLEFADFRVKLSKSDYCSYGKRKKKE